MKHLPPSLYFLQEYIDLGKEDESVELKSRYDLKCDKEELAKDMCAVANSCNLHDNGYIIIGVLDEEQRDDDVDNDPIPGFGGVNNFERSFIDLTQNTSRDLLKPRLRINVNFVDYNSKRICIIKISPYSRPYYLTNTKKIGGKYWVRFGSRSEEIDGNEFIELFKLEIERRSHILLIKEISNIIEQSNESIHAVKNYIINKIEQMIEIRIEPNLYFLRFLLQYREHGQSDYALKDLERAIFLFPKVEFIKLYISTSMIEANIIFNVSSP